MDKILIAVDDGPTSEKVALQGFQLAQRLKAEIALLSVVDNTLMTEGNYTPQELTEMNKTDLKRVHQLLIDKIFKNYKVWSFVEVGNPSETILKVADEWEAGLIVLCTHGRTGLSHLLTGSVAEKVIRHSVKPLFIIPTK